MERLLKLGKAVGAGALAIALMVWFHAVLDVWSRRGFWLNYDGMEFPDPSEVYFVNYYLAFGIPALCLFAYVTSKTLIPELLDRFVELASKWRGSIVVLTLLSLVATLLLKHYVLLDAVVTDDEYAFRFIADTLLHGRIVNPLPAEPQFYQNQFIVLNDQGWYGKYPIGHPLLLMLGSLAGARYFVVPLVNALLLVGTYLIGRKVYDRQSGFLGALLLALSPQFLLTGGTDLSQPSCALFATLGVLALLRLEETGRMREAFCCGLAFGYAVLVRPLPGALYLPVAGLYLLVATPGGWAGKLKAAAVAVIPVILTGALLLWVNALETGNPLSTGYHAAHKFQGLVPVRSWQFSAQMIGGAVGSALMRQNIWQTGFPLILLFAIGTRRTRKSWLVIGMVAAQFSYRLASPKSGVMSTGPVYMYEAVGWLALLTADGLRTLASALDGISARRWVASIVTGGFIVAGLGFWPVQVKCLRLGANAHRVVYDLVSRNRIHQAVVFYDVRLNQTWAHWLRNPQPDLSDDVIYLRKLSSSYAELQAFAERRFANRTHWVFQFGPRNQPRLVPLRSVAALEQTASTTSSAPEP